jgi:eukaryotic-like serine/threonine-protein kinase
VTVEDRSAIDTGAYRPGDVIANRYTLISPLGAGGMGVVWLAHANNLGVNVALKLLRGSLAGTQAVDRMAREARAAAKLGHYAMARVLDFGQTESDHPFLVMELLEGESLRELLDRKARIEPVRAVRTLLPIADALMAAHDKGIVHRDVKPGNIFISHEDQGRLQPKLLDFGVAKLEETNLDDKRRKLTDLGAVLGSPDYLSPEQA